MYQFPDTVNLTNFFRMNKFLIMQKHWAGLPLASKSIYPVIGIHGNKDGVSFPSQETIGAIAGCTPKTVREGLNGLQGFPGFYMSNWLTSRGRRAKRYCIQPATTSKGESIRIYRAFFDGGNWRLTPNSAKAVYPVLQCFSFFDLDIYWDLNVEADDFVYDEFFTDGRYENREFDIAQPEIDVLAEYSGLSHTSVYDSIKSLEKYGFIQEQGEYIKVFRTPPHSYDNEWLNLSLQKLPTK